MTEWKLKPRCKNTYIWKDWTVYQTIEGSWCLKRGDVLLSRFKRQQDARACAEREQAEEQSGAAQ